MTDTPQLTPAPIMQLGMGFFASKTLLSAVELGVFSELARAPGDCAALTARLGLHARAARDFLDALVALRMLERDASGVYRNTPMTDAFLDRAKPGYIGGLLEMANARLWTYWGRLTEALRTGQAQNETRDGGDPFRALYADPARLEGFLRAMSGVSLPAAQAMAAAFPWGAHTSFVDIGCAQGALVATIAAAHPHLAAAGFDLPPVGPVFEQYIAGRGVSARFLPGSFFTDPLPTADVLVMGHILHDWDLDQKRMLLAKAHAALPDGGALIVYETLIDDDRRESVPGFMMSLNMLIETPGGFDFSAADCIGWMREAGFRDARAQPLAGATGMVVGVK